MRFCQKRPPAGLFLMPLLLLAFLLSAQPAVASTEFQKEFVKLYAKGKEVDKDYKKLVRKGKCYVCHQGKEDRKNCNIYGKILAEYLTKEDEKDKEKIIASIKLVADKSSDPDSEDSPTFGELIAEGKLPGGLLADSKIEPPEAEGETEGKSSDEKNANKETDDDVSDN